MYKIITYLSITKLVRSKNNLVSFSVYIHRISHIILLIIVIWYNVDKFNILIFFVSYLEISTQSSLNKINIYMRKVEYLLNICKI